MSPCIGIILFSIKWMEARTSVSTSNSSKQIGHVLNWFMTLLRRNFGSCCMALSTLSLCSKNIWKVRRDERSKRRASEPPLLYTSMDDKTRILLVWENLWVNNSIGTSKAQVSITWLMSWIHLAWGKVQAWVIWCNVTAIMMSRHLLNGCSWAGSPIWCPNQLQ
jgi:hypothetical protein